jgi:hypothetical protein
MKRVIQNLQWANATVLMQWEEAWHLFEVNTRSLLVYLPIIPSGILASLLAQMVAEDRGQRGVESEYNRQ